MKHWFTFYINLAYSQAASLNIFNTEVYHFHTCSLSNPPDNHRDTTLLLCYISRELRRSGCNSQHIFPVKSVGTLCQTLFKKVTEIERALEVIDTKFLKDSSFIISNEAKQENNVTFCSKIPYSYDNYGKHTRNLP